MIKDLTPSVLDTDLFDLRKAFKVCKAKYSAIYPQNNFYVFLSNISVPKSEYLYLTPVYFDITDNVIRCGRDEGYLFRTEIGYASFNTEINLYENADIEYTELAKFEYEDKEVYQHLFVTLQELNGICVPYIHIDNQDKSVIDLSKHLDIGIGFNNFKTHVTVYNSLKVNEGNIIFNDVKMTTEEFTPINILRKLFRSFDYDVLIKEPFEIELKLSSSKDTFNTLSISLAKPRIQQSQVLTDGKMVSVVKARTTTSYVSELVINLNTEEGSDIFTSVLQWLLNIGRWINSTDIVFADGKEVNESIKLSELFAKLNVLFHRISYGSKDNIDTNVELLEKGTELSDAVASAFNYDIEDNYTYNCDGLMIDMDIEGLKKKLEDNNINSEDIDVVPGRIFKDGNELHGIIFVNLNTQSYGFYSKMFDIFLPDLFLSPMLQVSNGKEVIKSLFRCIRNLNVKEFLSTMYASEEIKDFGLSEKKTNTYLTLGVGGQVKEGENSKTLMSIILTANTSVRPAAGSMLNIEDLNPQKFKDLVYKVFYKL
mgnify:CR=1 FL=1